MDAHAGHELREGVTDVEGVDVAVLAEQVDPTHLVSEAGHDVGADAVVVLAEALVIVQIEV